MFVVDLQFAHAVMTGQRMTSANKQDTRACEGWDIMKVGHAGSANLSKPITAIIMLFVFV